MHDVRANHFHQYSILVHFSHRRYEILPSKPHMRLCRGWLISVTSQMKLSVRNIKHVIIQSSVTGDSFGNTRAHANNEYADFLDGWLYFKNIGYTSILVTFHVVSAETSHIIRDRAQTEQFLQKWIWGIYRCRWVATGNGSVPTSYIHVCCGESLVGILFSFNLIRLGNHQTKSQFKFNSMFNPVSAFHTTESKADCEHCTNVLLFPLIFRWFFVCH